MANSGDSMRGFSILRVQSRTIGQTTIVVFGDERRDYPFFQIDNKTPYIVHYAQQIAPAATTTNSNSSSKRKLKTRGNDISDIGGGDKEGDLNRIGNGLQFYALPPFSAVPFSWSELLVAKKWRRIVLRIKDRLYEKTISLDNNGYFAMIQVVGNHYVYIQVQNRGATKVLTICEDVEEKQELVCFIQIFLTRFS